MDTIIDNTEKQAEIRKRFMWLSIFGALAVGVGMIAMQCVHGVNKFSYVSALGCGVLIAGASMLAGGFLGFIFGVPSITQDPLSKIKYNDNLIQISDWLTKIIVGVGLTSLTKIPSWIFRLGGKFQINFGNDEWGRNIAIAIICFFFLLGFLTLYFWTKTDYSKIVMDVDEDLARKKLAAAEIIIKQEKGKSEAVLDAKNKMAEALTKEVTLRKISQSPTSSDLSSLTELQNNSSKGISTELQNLKDKVATVLPNKKIIDKEDIQKGRWGGLSVNNGKKISATVSKNQWQDLYDVNIKVESTVNGQTLDQAVAVFVHDSYGIEDDVVYVAPDASKGGAVLNILAWEAFTVGALCTDGTELELDLNEQKGYPKGFYYKDDKSSNSTS
jgi:hypothetical protein